MADAPAQADDLKKRSGRLTDVALTLPVFLAYHLGVVFLPTRNAADPVTGELAGLAANSLPVYIGITLAIGALAVLLLLGFGQKDALNKRRFLAVGVEGALYACLMRTAGAYVTASLPLDGMSAGAGNAVMALGAGFYEEMLFRVAMFGGGALVLMQLAGKNIKGLVLIALWAAVEAMVFSGWHHVGAMGEAFDTRAFVFRAVCGFVLTAIFALRGFAPAVWTHALYDLWVMV